MIKALLYTFTILLSAHAWGVKSSNFFSVSKVIESVNENDVENHRILSIQPPEVLYHWLSIESAFRLFKNYNGDQSFPLKVIGNDTVQPQFSFKVPGFYKKNGMFTWHNPVGATIGGSGEIYGNNEALLALKVKQNARIGLIVTLDNYEAGSEKLNDPKIIKNYDLILHVTGLFFDRIFARGMIEWVVINPDIVTDFTLDANVMSDEMNRYKLALEKFDHNDNASLIEKIAGPQHAGLVSHSISPKYISELMSRITNYHKKLDKLPFSRGWHSRTKSCLQSIRKKT